MTDDPSRDSTRALIRELVASGRVASPDEVARIRELMATAPFDPRVVRVEPGHRDRAFLGVPLGRVAPSLRYPVAQRTLIEGQWVEATSELEFVSDLARSILAPTARLIVYDRRGGLVAATVTPTTDVLPLGRLGQSYLPHLLVVYSADRDIIVTGYQSSTLDRVSIPREARWLT